MPTYETIDQLPRELNIRDLGGLPTQDGRKVKRRLLFRSSALAFFDEEEMAPVKALGLRTILDLRAEKGVEKRPDPAVEGAAYYNKCAAFQNILEDLNSPGELLGLIFDEEQRGNPIDVLVASYTASLAFTNEAFQFMFDCLLDNRVPMLFHCSNGKDRTGIAAMLILLALGVPEELVKKDYLLSNEYRKEGLDDLLKRYDVISSRLDSARSFLTIFEGVLPESADMLISEIQERYGSYENFMDKEYGVNAAGLKCFRDMYLED